MNGAETLEEVDGRPPYLCAMCLKKLHLLMNFDPISRYLRLSEAWSRMGCEDTSRWYETRVGVIRSTLASYTFQPPVPEPQHLALLDEANLHNLNDSCDLSDSFAVTRMQTEPGPDYRQRTGSEVSTISMKCADSEPGQLSHRRHHRSKTAYGADRFGDETDTAGLRQELGEHSLRPVRVSCMEAPPLPGDPLVPREKQVSFLRGSS